MSTNSNWKRKYPRNWKKVSKTIRRIAGYRCELCGKQEYNGLSVHHKGIGYVNGAQSDKHDLRRENLQSLCCACHNEIDSMVYITRKMKKKKRKRRERIERHRALGIGVGLVLV